MTTAQAKKWRRDAKQHNFRIALKHPDVAGKTKKSRQRYELQYAKYHGSHYRDYLKGRKVHMEYWGTYTCSVHLKRIEFQKLPREENWID